MLRLSEQKLLSAHKRLHSLLLYTVVVVLLLQLSTCEVVVVAVVISGFFGIGAS